VTCEQGKWEAALQDLTAALKINPSHFKVTAMAILEFEKTGSKCTILSC
jgi:hypothetical protein